MMRPQNLTTKIYLDSADPQETRVVRDALGFLDGQTTNPTLVTRNPALKERLARDGRLPKDEVIAFYRSTVQEISALIPEGSVSIEVDADCCTTSAQMIIDQAHMMNAWIPNAHIKVPIIPAGLEAAQILTSDGIRVNMTLCFSQSQAAAVHSATRGAAPGAVYVSPFIGRLDDVGSCGTDIVKNILAMYRKQGSHVDVLAASVRNMDHFSTMLSYGVDCITAKASILLAWARAGMPVPQTAKQAHTDCAPIAFEEVDLMQEYTAYNSVHPLTDTGLAKFTRDWQSLVREDETSL